MASFNYNLGNYQLNTQQPKGPQSFMGNDIANNNYGYNLGNYQLSNPMDGLLGMGGNPEQSTGMAGMGGLGGLLGGLMGGGGLAAILPYAISTMLNLYGSHQVAKNTRNAIDDFNSRSTPPPSSRLRY